MAKLQFDDMVSFFHAVQYAFIIEPGEVTLKCTHYEFLQQKSIAASESVGSNYKYFSYSFYKLAFITDKYSCCIRNSHPTHCLPYAILCALAGI